MTLNVSLTPHLEEFVRQTVTSGRCQSASEVVRAALRLLKERERENAARLQWLRHEIQKGLDSGPSQPLTDEFWHDLRDRLRRSALLGRRRAWPPSASPWRSSASSATARATSARRRG